MPPRTTASTDWKPQKATTAAVERFKADFEKSMGPGLVIGRKAEPYKVIPTGSLVLDAKLGVGGWPIGRIHELWGPDGAGKTTLAILAAIQAQRTQPDKLVGWNDMEQNFDVAWAVKHGLDMDRVAFYTPRNAEDTADSVTKMIRSGLFSYVTLDSVGGMISRIEQEKNADEATVGLVAKIVTRAVKNAAPMANATGTTLMILNQVRCVRKGTLVPTSRGLLVVEEVEAGDVIDSGSGGVEVRARLDSGLVDGVGIYPMDLPPLWVSNTHRQIVVGPDGLPAERLGSQVQAGDWVICPVVEPEGWGDVDLDLSLAAMLGLHFADGSIYSQDYPSETTPTMRRISVGERSAERLAIARRVMCQVFGLDAVKPMGPAALAVHRSAEVERFAALGVGGRHGDKLLPDLILRARPAVVREFLRYASFDTHAFDHKGFIWTGESESHLVGIAALLRKFGVHADLRHAAGYPRLHITGQDAALYRDLVGFAEESKQAKAAGFSPSPGARGKRDLVPPSVVDAVFGWARRNSVRGICSLPHYQAINMVTFKGLNGSRQRLLEFCLALQDDHPEMKAWAERLTAFRYREVRAVVSARFDAVDLEVEGGLFVAGGVLTHNSKIGGYGPDEVEGGGWALKHVTTTKSYVRRGGGEPMKARYFGQDVPVGYTMAVRVQRNKVYPAGEVAEVVFRTRESDKYGPIGVDAVAEAFEVGKRFGAIEQQPGGWYLSPDGERVKGEDNLKAHLRSNPQALELVRGRALEALSGKVVDLPDGEEESPDEDDPMGIGDML